MIEGSEEANAAEAAAGGDANAAAASGAAEMDTSADGAVASAAAVAVQGEWIHAWSSFPWFVY